MKLHNYTLLYLSGVMLLIIGIWAGLFYFEMLDEVYDSIDDGLENQKLRIIEHINSDTTRLANDYVSEGNYTLKRVDSATALRFRDTYADTVYYHLNEGEYEPARMLKTAFRAADGRYYQLTILSSMVEEDDLIEDLLFGLVWLYIALLASIIIINNVLLRRIWVPFYRTIAQLRSFRLEGTPQFKPVPSKIKEFQALNETIGSLLQRNIESYNSQKQFIENAAHELQTPIAISINKLELLVETEALNDDQMQTVAQVLQTLNRLTRLNKLLLLLTKIENRQFPDVEPVYINDLATRQLADFADFADYKKVALRLTETGTLTLQMNRDLAEILLTNLLKNAIAHSPPGAEVELTITNSALTIANSGPKALDAQSIFKRFNKDSDQRESTGLGLAIVKSIADLYGLQINYRYEGKHIFELRR